MRYLIGRLVLTTLFGVLLFVSAGRLDWLQAWVYLGAVFLGELVSAVVLMAVSPETIAQRGGMGPDTKTFDKVFVTLWLVLACVAPVVAGLDVGRSSKAGLPFGSIYLGLGLLVFAYLLGTWAMAVNKFFELTVRIQKDRGHQVVGSGPYRIVRHPGYVAAIAGALASPLILSSVWVFAPVAATVVLFVVRTALEDQTLQAELGGYPEYAVRTRYRLLPGIW
jgi:protein-S-isoprenylcysteine O-methyltransferase Ste14